MTKERNNCVPQISIIVPVYNVEPYLERCVNSIIAQTYKDFELILVDDGSTDNSGRICDSLQEKDTRINVIHKANGGLSSARNAGIEKAVGRYIGFVDSDDFIEKDMYEILYRLIIQYQADLSMCRLADCFEGETRLKEMELKEMVLSPEEAIIVVLEGKITSVTAVNKLYKRELFNDVRYPLGKTTEDAYVIVDLLSRCHKCVLTTEAKYCYVHRENSITSSPLSKANLDVIDAYRHNLEIVKRLYPAALTAAYSRYIWAHLLLLERMLLERKEQDNLFDSLKHILRANCKFIFLRSNFSVKKKISIAIFLIPFIGNKFYKRLLRYRR